MADYNSVPLGQAGTGSAFVLGRSKAADQLVENIDYNRKVAQQNELLRRQQAQQIATDWKTNALKVDGGLYWQPEFNQRYQQHMDKGIKLRQMGVNPFNYNANDPTQSKIAEDYLLERQGILSDTANRKATEAEIKKSFDMVRKDPNKYYASDIEGLNKYVNTPYAEAMNMPVPSLEERFNPNELLAKITPAQVGSEVVVGNKRIKSVKALPAETRTAIVSAYNNDASTARFVDELTGNQGFTIRALEQIPNTKEEIEKSLKSNYNGNPDLRTQLATQGITPNTKAYDDFIQKESNRLYEAKSKWNNQIQSDLNQVLPKVNQMSSVLPDYTSEDQDMQRKRLAMEQQRLNIAKARGDGSESELYRQDLVGRMLSGVSGSGEEIKAIAASRGDYTEPLKIKVEGDVIKIAIPPKQYASANEKGDVKMKVTNGRTVSISKNDPNAAATMNAIVSEVTKENVSYSKFKSGNAGGKIPKKTTSTKKPETVTKKATFVGIPKGGF